MDILRDNFLLDKIGEFVIDMDLIVTNAILSEKLGISLAESSRILKKFIRGEIETDLLVTYLISGKLKTGEYCIQIVDSVSLKAKKNMFSSISSEVVYSVQKYNYVDFNMIVLSEHTQTTKPNAPKGSIIGERCTQQLVKSKALPPPPPQKNFEKQKTPLFFKPVVKTEADCEIETSASTSKNNNKSQIQKKTGGLSGFLSQASSSENKQQIRKISSDEDTRDAKRPKMESNSDEKSKIEIKEENKMEECGKENGNSNPILLINQEPEEKTNSETVIKKETSKKVNRNKKSDGKKRKRIIVQSDSDDDLFGNDDEDEKIDVQSEDEKPVIEEPKEIIPKNKRRKAVEKVYTDDEGYVVTKTEYVLVSASDDEESQTIEKKPNTEIKPLKKIEQKSPPQKSTAKGKKAKPVAANQTTLMSFFKKK